jgi:hypothetical protein
MIQEQTTPIFRTMENYETFSLTAFFLIKSVVSVIPDLDKSNHKNIPALGVCQFAYLLLRVNIKY